MNRTIFFRTALLASLAIAGTVAVMEPGRPAQGGTRSAGSSRADIAAPLSGSQLQAQQPPAAEKARLPRATGVSNSSYDTKVDGATFVFGAPASSPAKFELRFGPVVVKCGDEVLSGGNVGEYDVANGGFEAKRGAVAERYMYDANRVEQLVVIPEAPAGRKAISVASPLDVPGSATVVVQNQPWREPRFASGGLQILDDAGNELASIYGARAVDAAGRQLDLNVGWESGCMTMTVPDSFVAVAQFPLTVDPWVELALSGTSGVIGTSAGFYFPQASLILGPADEPYVAFAAGGPPEDIVVRTFDSGTSSWVDVGVLAPFATPGVSSAPQLACPTGTATPFVVWTEDVGGGGVTDIYARQFVAGAWGEVFGSATATGISATGGANSFDPCTAIDSAGNQYVCYTETAGGVDEIYLKVNLGAGWVEIGGSATGGGISGTPGANMSSRSRITIDSLDRPVVTWTETVAGSNYVYARRFDGVSWVELGGSGSGTGISTTGFSDQVDVTFDGADEPVICWREDIGPTFEIFVRRFDGAAWVEMAGSGSGTGISGSPGLDDVVAYLSRDTLGNPVIAWNADTGAPTLNQIFVKRWNGSAWTQLEGSATSPTGISGTPPPNFSPQVEVDSAGRPAVVWHHIPTGEARYRQYRGLSLPTVISQTTLAGAPILVGAATSESFVRFTGAVVSNNAGEEARLQVEVKPIGTAFTGVPTAESSFTAAGSTAEVTIPLAVGTYHWQARFESSLATMPRTVWSSFPLPPAGNSEASTDFAVGVAPAAPVFTDLTQHEFGSGAALADGGSTTGGGITFRYTPSVALPEALRLQIDYTGDSIVDVESPLNPSGSTAAISISVPLPLGGYDWQARLANAAGLASGFTGFEPLVPAGVETDFTIIATPPPVAPAAPVLASLTQTRTDATAIVPVTGFTIEPMVVLGATLTGAPGDIIRLQLDVEKSGSGLDAIPDFESPLVVIPGGGSIAVTYTVPLGDGAYVWAARAQSSLLASSGWTPLGSVPQDFNVDAPGGTSGPPASPTIVGQFQLDGTTAITLTTGTTIEPGAVFRATLPASSVDMLRLQVEIAPSGSGFAGIPNAESALVPGGTTVGISLPLGAGGWHWRVRTTSSLGAPSAWVEAVAGTGADLTVLPFGATPTAPGSLAQRNLDLSPIATGGTAVGTHVVLEAALPGGFGLVKAQFEIQTAGSGFTGAPDIESVYISGPGVVQVTVPLPAGSYQWQVRTLTSTGLTSAFTDFVPFSVAADFIVTASGAPPVAPGLPTSLTQLTPAGVSVPAGTTIAGNTVLLRGTVPGVASDLNRLQVEVVPSASFFTGLPTFETPLAPGGSVMTITASLADNSYMWRARAFSSFDIPSAGWADFSGPLGTDFSLVGAGTAPGAPTLLAQQNSDGSAIASGGTATSDIVVFVGTVTGASGEPVSLQVEYATGAFTGVPKVQSPLVSSGTAVSVTVPLAPGSYSWQARTTNGTGAASAYAGFPLGGPDFIIPSVGAPVAPAPPLVATFAQRNLDLTVIATGGSATGSHVVLEAVVPASVAQGRIQFEISNSGIGHTGTPDVESVLVAGGTTVQVTVPLPPGGYHWQAQTQSSNGLTSGFVEFAGGTGADFVIPAPAAPPAAPATPLPIDQLTTGGASVPGGGTVSGDTIVLSGTIPGAPGDLIRLQVEVVPAASAFTSNPGYESPLLAGGSAIVAQIPIALPDGAYKWRARSFSSFGLGSLWVDFGGAVGTDFVISSAGVTPPVPAALDQQNPDGSSIAGGGTAATGFVDFVATVTGGSGEAVRLQVDFAPTGFLTGIPDVESPLVPSGSTVQITVPFAVGSYEWQARTTNGSGAASGFVGFGAAGTDFVVTAGAPAVAPSAPALLDQQNLDGSSIASGATAAGSTVMFEVVVPGLVTDLNRAQIDFAIGAPDGVPDVESALVPGGSTVHVAVPLALGSYNWQARTLGSSGLFSGFTPFPGGPDDFVVAAAAGPAAPAAPLAGGLDQQNLDGSSISSGGTALSNIVVFEAVVPGLATDMNRIQVDVEPAGTLDGVADYETPFVPGGSVVQIQASFANGSYDWQARTLSSLGPVSGYTPFPLGGPDFVVAAGGPTPAAPGGLTQDNSDGSALASGATTVTNTVLFGGTVTTTPAGGMGRLQVEFAAPGGLTGNPDVESPLVPDGTVVSLSVALGDGSYEWQARNQGSGGAVSAWTLFAGGPTDFVVAVGGGGAPPSAPSGLDQQNLDGSSIPAAGAATGSTVVFEAVVGGAPGTLDRLQVEFNPTGPGFSGVPDVESPLVTAGSTVHIAVPQTPGTFQWQARTQSSMGAVSGWVEFAAGGGTDYIVTSIAGGPAPADPIALGQFRLDGVTAVPSGGTVTENAIVFRATLPGAVVDLNRLQVEYLNALTPFTGNPVVESPLVPGGTTISISAPVADGDYKWRARSQSSSTAVSLWVDFGAAAGTDFTILTAGVPPPAPSGLAQQNADGTAIAPGGTAVTDVVRFGASVTSAVPGEEVRLQVDFAPVGGLSGTADVESPLVPSGSFITITIPLGDGSYEWQARAKAASGAVSAYVAFGGSSGVSADFVVSAGAGGIPPGVPTGITQRRLDGTVIAAGGTTSGDTVVFEGTVSGPPGSFLRLEVEYASFGSGLAGVPDVESPLVPTGSTVQIAVALGDGSYEWQARARTSTGAVSAFSPAFGTSGVSADFVVAAGSGGVPPAPPSGIGQFRIDGFSAIPAGGTVTDDKLIFRGTVAGLVTNLFRFQVEYVDSAGAFIGNPTVESPLVPGSSLVSIAVPIGDGNYMWRARSQSSTGASSTWVDFSLPAGIDFTIASSGLTPPVPVGLAQETLGGAPIPAGGTTFSDTVVFRSTVTSATPGGLVRLQVEFASPASLGGIPDVESPLVPSGTSVTIAVPLGDGSYEWQARAVSPTGLASPFVPFGGTTGVTDFVVSAGSGGPAPLAPSGLAQRRLDQSLIPSGGTTSGDTVIFESLITGAPGSLLRLQVEYAISGGGLTGIPDVESVLVPTGSTVQIAVPLGDGSYEWQARTQSSLGAVSAFVEFNPVPAAVDFVVASGVGAIPPGPPTALEQRTIDGALVPSGGTVSDDTIVFRGTVPAGPLFVRMQVEFVILPTAFTGVPSVESPLVPGGSVVSIFVPVADGSYGWHARAQTSTGGASGYSDFGLPTDTDFVVVSNGLPPPAPAGLAQLDSVGSPIAPGGTTYASTVQFQAVSTGALPGDSVRLQVDFATPGSLSGVADVESPAAPSGSTVTIAVPLGNGTYEWQCRTLGPAGAVSPWTEFVAGPATDFTVDAGSGVTPPAPSALDQLELDGTPIPSGATVYESSVKFTGTVSTTDGSLARLQVDFSPLSGVVDVESPLVPSGSAVEITVALGDGSYEWQARTASSTSAVSPFAPFAGGPPDFVIDADESTNPPATPVVLGQQDPLGLAIAVGGDCNYDSIVLFATLPGLPTDLIRLQLEIKPVADVFTGLPDVESVLLPGGSTALVTVPLGDGSYHWQARAMRSVGVSSAWLEFGANPTADTDFVVNGAFPGFAPPDPTSLGQFDENLSPIGIGDEVDDGDVWFRAFVDGDPAKMFKLQIEVRSTADPFTGLVTHESMFYPAGSTAEIAVHMGSGPFQWRARTITSSAVTSGWVSFGGNADGEIDFEVKSPQDGVQHHYSRKTVRRCGLTGIEFPVLFGLWLVGRKGVRRIRKGSSAK